VMVKPSPASAAVPAPNKRQASPSRLSSRIYMFLDPATIDALILLEFRAPDSFPPIL
jgi:hypothetical protein